MSRFLSLLFVLCLFVLPVRAQTAEAEFGRADTAWEKEDFAAAETHFGRALDLAQGDSTMEAHALFGRGLARLEQEQWQTARDDLSASIALNPDNAEAFASRGMARKALGDYQGLLADAHQATALDPTMYAGFEDAAKSTVNWRRMITICLVVGCVIAAIAVVPLVRAIVRVSKADAQARKR